MATPDDFRRIALSFEGAQEGAHMGHADFRVGGRIFATLGAPDTGHGMVALMAEQQEDFMLLAPAFRPAAGAWGRKGSALVRRRGRGGRARGRARGGVAAAFLSAPSGVLPFTRRGSGLRRGGGS